MGYNSTKYIHTLYQVMNLAFADRDFYYGDPYFPPEEPIKGLLSKRYAQDRAATINRERNDPLARPGDPYPYQGGKNPYLDILKTWTNAPDPDGELMPPWQMADIDPLLRALTELLKPGAPFLFSLMHPCFNNPYTAHVAEMEDREGEIVEVYSMKVRRYMTPGIAKGLGIPGQPKPQLYFHRPLQVILGKMFAAGFVLDALEERAFPPDHSTGRYPLSWSGKFSEIPPVLIGRVRLP